MSEIEFLACLADGVRKCPTLMSMHNVIDTTCLMDIYLGNMDAAMTKCNYRIFSGTVPPSAIYLSNATYAISTAADELRLTCDADERIIRDPRFMIINLPCRCNMAFDKIFVPKAASNCHEQDVVQLAHLVNFAQIHAINSVINISFSADPIAETSVYVPSEDDVMTEIINKAKEADAEQGLSLMQAARAVHVLTPPPPPSDMWLRLFMDLPWQGIVSCVIVGVWGLAISVCVGYFGYRLYVINLALVAMAPQGLIPQQPQPTPPPVTSHTKR